MRSETANAGKGSGSGKGKGEKFSRSTIACNGCRLRKQRCGGEKPICLRCRTLKKPCVWPEQLKRGPSKGYNESLEQRLRETEIILTAVLDAISAFEIQLSNLDVMETPETDVTPSAAEKKLKLEEWANFPLRTGEDVLHWRAARVSSIGERSGNSYEQRVEDSMRHSFDGSMEGHAGVTKCTDHGTGETFKAIPESGPFTAEEYEHYIPPDHTLSQAPATGGPDDFENFLPPVQGYATTTVGPPISAASRVFGLSREFQDSFLW